MRFFLKNYVAGLLSPTPLIGLFLILGFIFLLRNKLKHAKISIGISAILFIVFATDPLTRFVLHSYEDIYPIFNSNDYKGKDFKYIVVLGAGYTPKSELAFPAANRVMEGLILARNYPKAKVVFSGKGPHEKTEAKAMNELAIKLGFAADRIVLEEESMKSQEHPKYLRPIIGENPFILVTSALHMPRVMGLFKKAGYTPTPAPTAHIMVGEYKFMTLPKPYTLGLNLRAIDALFTEFWGLFWSKINGDI